MTDAEVARLEDDLVKADAAGMLLAAQLRAAKADVEAWQANANTHLAECLRLEKLVIERTAERDRLKVAWEKALSEGDDLTMRVMTLRKERDEARAELASARQETDRLRRSNASGPVCTWYEAAPGSEDVPDDYNGPCIHCHQPRNAHGKAATDG